MKEFVYLMQELDDRLRMTNDVLNPFNEPSYFDYFPDKIKRNHLKIPNKQRINNIFNKAENKSYYIDILYDITPIENLFIAMYQIYMAYIEILQTKELNLHLDINFPKEEWKRIHKENLSKIFEKKGIYHLFLKMDVMTIVYLAERHLLTNEDLKLVRNDLINLLSSNKPNIYYKVILKLGSEDVLSICEDREEFIQFLLSFGIRKSFLAYARQQFVHMNLTNDFLKAMMEMLIRRAHDLTFFEMISLFFALGNYRVEFIKRLYKFMNRSNLNYIIGQILNKCCNDVRKEKILIKELTEKEIEDLYEILINISEDVYIYKDLYKLSRGEIKEKIKASILLYDIKGA
jgi:uncharacterized membrane protein